MRLIDDYFPFATFYKATGDGLLLTVPFDEKTLQDQAQITVDGCLRSLREFAEVCKDDPMINFSTPDKIGFGVARGTACCLTSGDTVLDYSGHLLNLTTRLMDLARPSGIVLDGAFGLDLLSEETQALFEAQNLYIRSVAEEQPKTAFVLKGAVEIPEQAKRPLRFEHWETVVEAKTVREWNLAGPWWRVELPVRLKRADGLTVTLIHPSIRGGRVVKGVFTCSDFTAFRYFVQANQSLVRLDVDEILAYAHRKKLRRADTLTARISYVPE